MCNWSVKCCHFRVVMLLVSCYVLCVVRLLSYWWICAEMLSILWYAVIFLLLAVMLLKLGRYSIELLPKCCRVAAQNSQNSAFICTFLVYPEFSGITGLPEPGPEISGTRIVGYEISGTFLGYHVWKPESIFTRKTRPEISGKPERPPWSASTTLPRSYQ